MAVLVLAIDLLIPVLVEQLILVQPLIEIMVVVHLFTPLVDVLDTRAVQSERMRKCQVGIRTTNALTVSSLRGSYVA